MKSPRLLFSLFIISGFIFSPFHSVKAMDEEWDKHTGIILNDNSTMNNFKFKKRTQKLHALGLKAIEEEDYSSAFKNFLFVTFEASFRVPFQYDLGKEGESLYTSGTLTQFNHVFNHNETDTIVAHIICLHVAHVYPGRENEARNRAEAFGYVYILWQSNGEGLEKESSIGKSMGYCLHKATDWKIPQRLKPLIVERFPEAKQKALLKKSAGWVLK